MSGLYEWDVIVKERNLYGDKYVSETPATFIAATKAEVTEKMRAAFGAKYDDFRKFWSHAWFLRTMRELPARGEGERDE